MLEDNAVLNKSKLYAQASIEAEDGLYIHVFAFISIFVLNFLSYVFIISSLYPVSGSMSYG